MYYFKFADIGEGLHEGKVTKILVTPGAEVKDGDALFEVETDKVTSEITAPVNGKIHKIKIALDQIIHVGEVAFVIDDGSGPEDLSQESGKHNLTHETTASGSLPPSTHEVTPPVSNPTINLNGLIDAPISPLARKIAVDQQIDVNQLIGTGPNGRIMVRDLENISSSPLASLERTNTTRRQEPTTSLRQKIAHNLKQSWTKVAYVTQIVETNVTSLVDLRNQYKDLITKTTGAKLTYLPFIAKATALALQEFPIFTATYDESTQELIYPGTLNLGIAVDTEYGLVVPNIKNAQSCSVLQLSQQISQLATAAWDRKLSVTSMSGGHFTITNYGSVGAILGMPVIKFPEMAILGVGTIVHRVGADQKKQFYMYLTIAADHRWVDGVAIAQFASTIKKYLENPALLGVF